jgi:site-specific DNA-methyltransferase (adenine-specific)
MLELNTVYNMDCMEGMAEIPDGYFELAIVDPPYGIGEDKAIDRTRGGIVRHKKKNWDINPKKEYFYELFRVSKNQIVWGGNYFIEHLYPKMGWVFWDKKMGGSDFSDGELAWTSFDRALKKFTYSKTGGDIKKFRRMYIHPCEKPVSLYKWLLKNYAKQGDKILDTHMGSGSSIIACHDMGFEYMAFEIDKDYYEAAMKRINDHKAQVQMELPTETIEQCSIL